MLRELVDDGYRLEVLDEHTDTSDTPETAPEELGRLLAGSGHDHLDLLLIPNS